MLFQEILILRLKWEDELPDHLLAEYKKWRGKLVELYRVDVPTFYRLGRELPDRTTQVSLQAFADTSTLAYGNLIYLCIACDNGATLTALFLAKSRMPPVNLVTLPRLKLMEYLITSLVYQYGK